MRILQCYRFLVGNRIPFDKWPGIVEEYLHQQNLTHSFFHYYMENYDNSANYQAILDRTKCNSCVAPESACERCREEAAGYLRKATACERALKENPFLGTIKVRQTRYDSIQSLNNFSDKTDAIKENIYSILSKIYRRYGFASTSLIYRDINFFGQRFSTPAPEEEKLMHGYQGSGITLYRSCIANESAIIMVVESRYPGEIPDAEPYANALSKLLPGIKRVASTEIIMEAEEKSFYEEMHCKAEPVVMQAKEFFAEYMSQVKQSDAPESQVSIASCLKKTGKRYGYAYLGYTNYIYILKKELPNGHHISLEFVSSPGSPEANPYINLCGLGFRHEIWSGDFRPLNSQDASLYFTHLFEALVEAEQAVFPTILDLYPNSPGWFMPTY